MNEVVRAERIIQHAISSPGSFACIETSDRFDSLVLLYVTVLSPV
jgi:hypothetical protein